MAYEVNFCETKEQLKHIAEVASGKVDGSPSGADIDESTLTYTGQVRRTLPKLIEQFDEQRAILDAEASAAIDEYRRTNAGDYSSGPLLLEDKFTYATYNGDRFYAVSPPYTTDPVTFPDPNNDTVNLILVDRPDEQYVRQVAHAGDSQVVDGYIWPVDSEQNAEIGDNVPVDTSFVRYNDTLFAVNKLTVGIIDAITDQKITIAATDYTIYKQSVSGDYKPINIWQFENWVEKPDANNPTTWSWDNAYAAAIAVATIEIPGKFFYRYHRPIHFPAWVNKYWFDNGIEKKEVGVIKGDGSGLASGEQSATTLKFRHTDKPCFTNNRYNTFWGMLDPAGNAGFGADGSIYEGLLIEGSTQDSSFSDNHGIAMRSRAVVRDCQFLDLGGNGVHIHAASNGNAVTLGNANNWLVDSIRSVRVHHGLFVEGFDANAGASRLVDASSCRGFGILERSFLGNTHSEVHTASCGSGGRVSYDETSPGSGIYNCYQCIDDTLAGTTYPGTNPSVWRFIQESSNLTYFPPFQFSGVYYDGGSVKSVGLNSANLWNGLYVEGSQLGPILSQRDASVGGLKGVPIEFDLSGGDIHVVDSGVMWGNKTRLPSDGNQYVQVLNHIFASGEIRRIQRNTPLGTSTQTWEVAKDSNGHTEVGYSTTNVSSVSVGLVSNVSSPTDNARNGDAKLGRIYNSGLTIDQRSTPISGQYYKVGDRLLLPNGNVLICSVAGLGGSTAVFGKQIVATTV